MMREASLKRRMIVSITALVVIMTAVMMFAFLTIGQSVLGGVENKAKGLGESALKAQQQALDVVELAQESNSTEALQLKARNLASFSAKLAVTPMLSFDNDTLNDNVLLIYSDEDVLLCLIRDRTGKVLTREKNSGNGFVKEVLATLPAPQGLQELADALGKRPDVLAVEMPVMQSGNEIGKVQLFASRRKSIAQIESMRNSFNSLKVDLERLFGGFTTTLANYKVAEGSNAAMMVLAIALVAIIVMILVVTYIANSITRPIGVAVQAAERVASGDLTTHIQFDRSGNQDETGQLLAAIDKMTCNLNSLVSHVKHSSIQLVSTATGIAANVKQQQAAVSDFGSSTTEIAAAAKQISATSRELLQTMNDVSSVAGDTANLADNGRNNLREMESTIGQLGQATQSISTKLSAIREKADEINVVVTTITKVADQTNLLSLNASIEAEKAGEYGLGFAVVAREIRRLADQTAVATLDIEQMVKEMQGAVSAGVMEMDRFARDVQRGVEEVGRIGTQQGAIIERVQTLPPRFKQVNEGMQAQAQGAGQISDAMVQLNDGAQRTVSTLDEFSKAASDLHAAVNTLKEEVARFRIGS